MVHMPLQYQVLEVVREWSILLLAWLCNGLYEWCMRQVEPSTHSLLATQPQGRGGVGPLLRCRLACKNNIRGARRTWREDGAKWAPGPNSVLRQACSTHLGMVRKRFAEVPVLELCFDASGISIRNHDIFAAYTPTVSGGVGASCEGVGTYLPPVRVPELAWRERDADEPITEQDRHWWESRGWKSRRGVRAYQAMRSVQHVLVNMLSTTITDFVAPQDLSKMSFADTRVWDEQEGRWYRGAPPLPGACHRSSMVPELPHIGQAPRFLLLTMDQKQTQWNMAHFMASQWMCWFRGDLFHRSWNDFKWALKWSRGWLHHSMMQLCHAFNVNYGPFPRGGNTAKKQEIHMEWKTLKGSPCDRFRELVPAICMDLGVPEPATSADVDELYRREILEDSSFKKQGRMCKLGAWYDFIRACDEWTKHVTARRYHMLVISENLMGTGQAQAKMQQAAQELAKSIAAEEALAATGCGAAGDTHEKADDKAAHKQQMRDLKKRLGNMMLLAPCLLHSFNVCNMRIILAVGRLLWSEQTYLAVKKGTGPQDASWHSQCATGSGTRLLRQLWLDVVGSANELARVGIQTIDGMPVSDFSGTQWQNSGVPDDIGVPDVQEIPERLMSMVLHTLEARLWSMAWNECTMPEMLPALLAPDSTFQGEQIKYMEDLWHASVLAESEDTGSGSHAVRLQIYWLDWPAVQWLMRLLAHFHFQRHPILESIVRSVCTRMGDTKMIEEMFKHIRGAETKQQDPKVLDVLALYQKAITKPTPLRQRNIPVVSLSHDQWYTKAPASGPTNWTRITAKRGRAALPRACRRVLRSEGYVAKTPLSGRPSITAAMSLCLAYREDRLQHVADTWQTIAALPHTVIIHTTKSAAFLVLLSSKYAMRTWQATAVSVPHNGECDEGGGQSGEGGDIDSTYRFRRWVFNKQAKWEWMSVWNVEEWLYQPTAWCTLTDCQDVAPPANFGYLGCRATGKAVPLLAEALVRQGRTGLTVEARAKFVKAAEGVSTALECLQKILQDYPESLRQEYVRRWQQAEAARQGEKTSTPQEGKAER